jgi:hypothetical protein
MQTVSPFVQGKPRLFGETVKLMLHIGQTDLSPHPGP